MKAGKIVLIIVGILVLGIGVLIMTGPDHVHVERSVIIDAPSKMVMNHANTLSAMEKWSPWRELDPNQTTNIEGEDGTVGAKYTWEGNEDVGKGEQTLAEITDTKVVTDLHFIEPYEGMSKATFTVEEVEGGTKATWAFDSETNIMTKIMSPFMSMDEMLGPDFEKGVNKLKVIVEEAKANKKDFRGFNIQEIEMPATTYVGLKRNIAWEEMKDFFTEAFGTTFTSLGKNEIDAIGAPSAVYLVWDEANQRTELIAGAPVPQGTAVEGLETMTVPGGKAIRIDYYGDYEGSGEAHMAMEEYVAFHNLEASIAIEEYITDPMTEPDPSKWLTKITYPIK